MFWLILLIFSPISILLRIFEANPYFILATAALALIPLAGMLSKGTGEVAQEIGPILGGVLNATLGNATEAILALLLLRRGLTTLVKASITGGILSNLLLVLGGSMIIGGIKNHQQKFNAQVSEVNTGMLLLAVTGLLLPFVFTATLSLAQQETAQISLAFSQGTAAILLVTYLIGVGFTLYSLQQEEGQTGMGRGIVHNKPPKKIRGLKQSLGLLLGATIGVGIQVEVLVGALDQLLAQLPLPNLFIGVILLPLLANLVEHSAALAQAARDEMELALAISVGSSTQTALFLAPLLVLLSGLFGWGMDLNFTLMEVMALGAGTLLVYLITLDGRSNWFEGTQLVATYLIMALAFWFLPL